MTLTQRNVLIFAGLIAYSLGLLLPAPFNGFVLLSGVMCAMIWGLNRVIQQDAAITGVQVQAQTRRRLSRVALLLSIILFVWMMWFLHPARLYIEARLALSLVLPVALLAYPVFRLYRPVPHQTTSVYTNSHRKIRPELIAAGIILLCLLTLSNILPFDMRVSPFLSQHVQILFFIIGLMLLVMGFAGLTRRDLWMVLTWRLPGMILLITGLAFVVRMWNLEFGVHRLVDEFHFMQAVGDLWNGGEQRMLLPHGGITAFTWLYPYMQWQTSMITGASLTGLRLASVLIGTMQIPVIYLLGRELFNRRVAVVAALMLAILPLHVQFSRIGLNNIVDPLVGMLAMFFLVRGMRRGYPVYFVLAGLCLGLTHYFYEGGKLFYTLFIVLWLIWIRVFKRHDDGFYLPTRRQLRLMGGVFLLTIMPVYFAWWVNLFPLTPRVNKTSDGSLSTNILAILGSKTPLEELIEVFEPYFLMYLYAIDVSDFFTNERFLSLAGTGFFVIGSIVAAYRLRFVSYALVFWWMMGVPIGLALTIGTKPEVPRYIVVLPALALLIAVGLDESLRLLHAIFPKIRFTALRWQNWIAATIAIAISGAAIWQFHGVFLPDYYQRAFYHEFDEGKFARDSEDAMFRAMALPGSDVYIISPHIMNATSLGSMQLYYGRYGDDGIELRILREGSLTSNWWIMMRGNTRVSDQYFFIDPDNYALLGQLRETFPDIQGAVMSPYDIPSEKQYAMYYQPRIAPADE